MALTGSNTDQKLKLKKIIFTENNCYKAGRTISVKGIMVHSTGANNPWLKRYIGPDDGLIGKNEYGNHWNQPMNRQVCVHGFIGKLNDGTIAAYQTLPWNMRGWHAGGSANNTHIGFEICEDGLSDPAYFFSVYRVAVDLCVYLCKLYGLTEKDIICHSEGYKRGIASNHGDVMHWFPKHGKSMDTFRTDVKVALSSEISVEPKPVKSIDEIAQEVIAGKWGNGSTRKKALEAAGYKYSDVQSAVNVKLSGNKPAAAEPDEKTYTVVRGDSLWKIASKQLGKGSRWPEIKSLNGLKSNNIYAGQVLKLPRK